LRRELRAYDQVYRLGGEEFAVLLPGCDAGKAGRIAEHLRRGIAAAPVADLDVQASIGVASSPGQQPLSWEETFARADSALHRAKAGGRNRVVVDGAPSPSRPREPSSAGA